VSLALPSGFTISSFDSPLGRLIYPAYIWVDNTPTEIMKPLGMANRAHTWWYNMYPLNLYVSFIYIYGICQMLFSKAKKLKVY